MDNEVTTSPTTPVQKTRIQSLRDTVENAETHAQDAVEAFLKRIGEAKAKGEHESVSLSLEANKNAAEHANEVVRGLALRMDSVIRLVRSIAETLKAAPEGELTEQMRKEAQDEAIAMLFYGLQHLLPLMWGTSGPLLVDRGMQGVVAVKASVELALAQAEQAMKELGYDDEPRTCFGTHTIVSPSEKSVPTPANDPAPTSTVH